MKLRCYIKLTLPVVLMAGLSLAPYTHAETIETALNAYNEGNYTNALEILQRLAERGEPHAQYNLAAMYDAGNGVEENDETAVKWYAVAAEQGIISAAFNLGNMYREGEGVAQSYQDAVHWYQMAADKGDASAQYNLGAMYENGYGIERDMQQAADWYQKAAKQGLAHAQHRLGELYAEGDVLEQDPIAAFNWLNRAALQGYQPAKTELTSLESDIADIRRYIKGSGVNLRAGPSTSVDVISRLDNGQLVLVSSSQGKWVEVNVMGAEPLRGWVHSSLLKQ